MAREFPETSVHKINKEVFGKNLESIYGVKPSPFCDDCGLRHSYCECDQATAESDESENS